MTLRGLHLLAAAAIMLGGARWLALPRATPIAVWIVLLSVDLAALLFTRALVRQRTSVATVAKQLEQEQSLRAGSVRGTLEVADTGALGRRAAADLSSRLGQSSQ